MKNSKIEWTDHTFNPWSGCTKVSPGCANCYAETLAKRVGSTLGQWGKGAPRRRTSAEYWRQPLRWDREAAKALKAWCDGAGIMDQKPRRPRVFCASLADWLDDEVPIEWLADLLDLIRRTPHLDWLLLTKRPENWRARVCAALDNLMHRGVDHFEMFCWVVSGKPPANVWIGTTVEDQQRADERIPHLLRIPARLRFLSCEPLLGPVNIIRHCNHEAGPHARWRPVKCVDWIIVGGESGPKARPMHPDWARSLRDQCKAAGVPFLFKQWGEWAPLDVTKGMNIDIRKVDHIHLDDYETLTRIGKKAAGRLLDGAEHNEFPA